MQLIQVLQPMLLLLVLQRLQTMQTFKVRKSILYVAKDGNDSNSGELTKPKLTIKAAVQKIIDEGLSDTVVRVAPGSYIEDNPIVLPNEVSVIGASIRETTISPLNADQDIFHVGNANYIAEMSFTGTQNPGVSVVAFDPVERRYISRSTYVQNCTNFIPNNIGMKIDGDLLLDQRSPWLLTPILSIIRVVLVVLLPIMHMPSWFLCSQFVVKLQSLLGLVVHVIFQTPTHHLVILDWLQMVLVI